MKKLPMLSRFHAIILNVVVVVVTLCLSPILSAQAAMPSLDQASNLVNQVTGSSVPSSSTTAETPQDDASKSPSKDTGSANDANSTNPYAQLGPNGFDTRPAAPPAFTVPVYPSIEAYLVMVINFLLDFLALGVLVMLIYGGYMYTTAMGDSGKQKKARGIITSAIVGFFLVIISFAIVATIIAATRPGANNCTSSTSAICMNANGGNVNFGIGAGVGSLLSNIF